MGISIDQTATIKFTNEYGAQGFYNYLERLITKHYVNRQSGWDMNNFQPGNWTMKELSTDYDEDNTYLEYEIDDDNTVTISTCGYGDIPKFILSYAMLAYNAIGFYLKQTNCQDAEDPTIIMHYDKIHDHQQYIFVPNYARFLISH